MSAQPPVASPVQEAKGSAHPRILDLGCGKHKHPQAVGADRNSASQADVLCDLNRFPYPFRDDSFDEIHLNHVIEHLEDVVAVVAEIWRVARHGARVLIGTPHFSSIHSYTDPGHRQRLARGSFDQARKDLPPPRRIEVVRKEIRFHRRFFWSWPARLIYRVSPNKYEKFFAFVFPARELVFELRIVKSAEQCAPGVEGREPSIQRRAPSAASREESTESL
jgi:SAM-dependent methyltransferase